MNAFNVLGVSADATPEEIRAAYRRLARELHPDRHVQPDGSVPSDVHESFCELNRAVDAALKAQSVPVEPVQPVQPVQPAAEAAPSPAPTRPVPTQRRTRPARRPARFVDPVLALLTVPRTGGHAWSDEQLEFWALTLVPAARTHEAEARRLARAAGATTVHQHTLATAHALLTLSLRGRAGARAHRVRGALPSAYASLEADLPETVVARLPRPVVTPRARRSRLPLGAAVIAAGAGLAALAQHVALLPGLPG